MTEKPDQSLFTNQGPLKTNSLKNQAYRQIKDAILYRRLKLDVFYSQDDICSQLGISRTPVREALIELQSEGFIEFVRGRGFKVVEITRQEALGIIELRQEIEIFGASLAAERITDAQFDELKKLYQEMLDAGADSESSVLYRLDYKFHALIFAATGNSWLEELNVKLRENFLRIETQRAFATRTAAKQVFGEHLKILNAMEARNPTEAKRAMKNHMKHTFKRTLVNIISLAE